MMKRIILIVAKAGEGEESMLHNRGTKIRITADLLLEIMPEDSGITDLKD